MKFLSSNININSPIAGINENTNDGLAKALNAKHVERIIYSVLFFSCFLINNVATRNADAIANGFKKKKVGLCQRVGLHWPK